MGPLGDADGEVLVLPETDELGEIDTELLGDSDGLPDMLLDAELDGLLEIDALALELIEEDGDDDILADGELDGLPEIDADGELLTLLPYWPCLISSISVEVKTRFQNVSSSRYISG